MRYLSACATILGIALMFIVSAGSANAQATRTWVSGVGDDANPCSRTAPCKTFAGAISKTAAGGEIDVLDPGGFGAVTITKSITIDGSGGSIAGVLVSSTNGIIINDQGAGTAVVTLRNLDFEGIGFAGSGAGIRGIFFASGAALHVQRCIIRDFRDATNGTGIAFTPSTSAKLFVEDTIITGNTNSGASTGGIMIQPSGTASAKVSLVRVNLENNGLGVRADGTGSTGGIFVSMSDSVVSGNANAGIVGFSQGGATTRLWIDRTIIVNNGIGVNANGSSVTMRVGSSMITNNATGVNVANSATATSLGTNQINDNPTPGATLTVLGPT
jgi:hypothetical protein